MRTNDLSGYTSIILKNGIIRSSKIYVKREKALQEFKLMTRCRNKQKETISDTTSSAYSCFYDMTTNCFEHKKFKKNGKMCARIVFCSREEK